jgi:hypothetical protein
MSAETAEDERRQLPHNHSGSVSQLPCQVTRAGQHHSSA